MPRRLWTRAPRTRIAGDEGASGRARACRFAITPTPTAASIADSGNPPEYSPGARRRKPDDGHFHAYSIRVTLKSDGRRASSILKDPRSIFPGESWGLPSETVRVACPPPGARRGPGRLPAGSGAGPT